LFGLAGELHQERHGRLLVALVALDALNGQMGQGTLRFTAERTRQLWRVRRVNMTPGYTTDWAGLVEGKT